jgi:hypothetical protein
LGFLGRHPDSLAQFFGQGTESWIGHKTR